MSGIEHTTVWGAEADGVLWELIGKTCPTRGRQGVCVYVYVCMLDARCRQLLAEGITLNSDGSLGEQVN